jgi:hypothetical protein
MSRSSMNFVASQRWIPWRRDRQRWRYSGMYDSSTVAALARVMYCIHVLFRHFVSWALIQSVMDYKYWISIGEVSTKYHNLFIYLLIPIFLILDWYGICGISRYRSITYVLRYRYGNSVSYRTLIQIRQLGVVSVLLSQGCGSCQPSHTSSSSWALHDISFARSAFHAFSRRSSADVWHQFHFMFQHLACSISPKISFRSCVSVI